MSALPIEIYEQILSYLPFVNLLPLRRVSRLWNYAILDLLGRTTNNNYMGSWTMKLSMSSGHTLSIPLSLEAMRDATTFSEIERLPYIFSGPLTGIKRTDSIQVLKFEFW